MSFYEHSVTITATGGAGTSTGTGTTELPVNGAIWGLYVDYGSAPATAVVSAVSVGGTGSANVTLFTLATGNTSGFFRPRLATQDALVPATATGYVPIVVAGRFITFSVTGANNNNVITITMITGDAVGDGGGATGSVTIGAGSAIIGKVGIDQTTPGTTNGVVLNAAVIPTATTMQNETGTGNPNGTSLNVSGYPMALLHVKSSTPMSGGTTINFEASVDDTTWVSITGHLVGSVGAQATTATADGEYRFSTAGFKSLRARISAWSAGVTTVKGYVDAVAGSPTVIGNSDPFLRAGEDLTNAVQGALMKPVASATYAPSNYKDAGTVTKANVKATAGNVYAFRVVNMNAAKRFFQLHNKATAPAAAETAQLYFTVPGGSTDQPGIVEIGPEFFAPSEYFATGIGWAISTTATTFTDSSSAGDHVVQVRYV